MEPIGVLRLPGMLLMNVVRDDVEQDADASLVSGANEVVELGFRREAAIDAARRDRPVPVVAGVRAPVGPGEVPRWIGVERREPDRARAERLELAGLEGLAN